MWAFCGSGGEAGCSRVSAAQRCWAAVGRLSGTSHAGQDAGFSAMLQLQILSQPFPSKPPERRLREMLGQHVQTVAG